MDRLVRLVDCVSFEKGFLNVFSVKSGDAGNLAECVNDSFNLFLCDWKGQIVHELRVVELGAENKVLGQDALV